MFRLIPLILSVLLFILGCGAQSGGPPPPGCGPSTCAAGCCWSTTCMPGNMPTACGGAGGLCDQCLSYEKCLGAAGCRIDPASRFQYGVFEVQVPLRTDGSTPSIWYYQDGKYSAVKTGTHLVFASGFEYPAATILSQGATFQFFDRQPGNRDVALTAPTPVVPREADFGLTKTFTRTLGPLQVTFFLKQP